MKRESPQPRPGSAKMQMVGIGGAIFLVALVLLTYEKPRQEALQTAAATAPKDPRKRCQWPDGRIHNFAGQVQENLRNPPSFEHVRTDLGPLTNGVFEVSMTYRATNGFGGVDTSVAEGEVRAHDCSARITRL